MATYTIDKITLPNGDVCNLQDATSGYITDVQINNTSLVSSGVANIPYASFEDVGVISRGAQTIPGEKTFVATNGYGGSIIIDSNRIESGGQLTLKHRHADSEDPSVIGDTEIYTIKSNGDWGLEIGCSHVLSGGGGSGGTYILNVANGDYYLAYKATTTSSSTTPVYFSSSDGALQACSGVVVTTESQIFRGYKVFDSDTITIANGGSRDTHNYAQIQFNDKTFTDTPDTSTGIRAAYISCERTNVGSSLGNGMRFIIRSPKTDGTGYTSYYDFYYLPNPNAGNTANGYYNIITTKNISDIPEASASQAGLMTTGSQTFDGEKTFSEKITAGTSAKTDEHYVRAYTNSGTIYLTSVGNANGDGNRGVYVGPHGTATSGKFMLRADTNNNVFIADGTTCDGVFKVTGGLQTINTTGNGASAPVFIFSNAPTANAEYGRIFLSYSNYSGRLKFRQYSGSSSARTSYNETYLLPQCDASRSSSEEYDILTTKGTKTSTVSLTTAGWSSLTQSVTVTGMTASAIVIVTANSASTDMYRHCGVYCSAQAANSLTFKCASVPSEAITVNILTIG